VPGALDAWREGPVVVVDSIVAAVTSQQVTIQSDTGARAFPNLCNNVTFAGISEQFVSKKTPSPSRKGRVGAGAKTRHIVSTWLLYCYCNEKNKSGGGEREEFSEVA
jgi:hypothetical protein